jgi:dicarboxylate transporter 10
MASTAKLEMSRPSQQVAAAPPAVKKVHYPFWFGGSASCFAAAVTHPLDLGEFSFSLLLT